MTPEQREKRLEAVGHAIHGHACGCAHEPWPLNSNYREMAQAALDAADQAVPVVPLEDVPLATARACMRAEAELERLRPVVRHVAGLTHVDRGNDYASVHRTLVHQAREALDPTIQGDA